MTLLADRGVEPGSLLHWLRQQHWSWAIRVKSDLKVTLADGRSQSVEPLLPPSEQAYLFKPVRVLDRIDCHLSTAKALETKDAWAVLSDQPPSLQTFALYGKRFGGLEPYHETALEFSAPLRLVTSTKFDREDSFAAETRANFCRR